MAGRRKLAIAVTALAVAAGAVAIVLATTGGDDDAQEVDAQREEIARQVQAGELTPEEADRALREHRREQRTPDEREARGVARGVYGLLAEEKGGKNSTDVDSAAFCESMSAEAREETIEYVRRSSGIAQEWDCESAVEQLVIRSKRQGGFKAIRKAKVIGVNAEGDRATASIRFGNGTISSLALVREDGDWKLASAPAGTE